MVMSSTGFGPVSFAEDIASNLFEALPTQYNVDCFFPLLLTLKHVE